jgi:hypothetical protein
MKHLLTILLSFICLNVLGQNFIPNQYGSGQSNQLVVQQGGFVAKRYWHPPFSFNPYSTYDSLGMVWIDSAATKKLMWHNGTNRRYVASEFWVDSLFATAVTGVTQDVLDDSCAAIRDDFPAGGSTDSSIYSTKDYRQKAVDSLNITIGLRVNYTDTANMLANYLSGLHARVKYTDSFPTTGYTTRGRLQKIVDSLIAYYATNPGAYLTAETDPIFSVSAAAGISALDIDNWNDKLDAVLNDGRLFVGNVANVPVGVIMSGDATIDNTGAVTIANGAVTNGKLANSSISINGSSVSLGGAVTVNATPSGNAGGDLTGTYPNPTLATSGVTAGTYGSATIVPIVTVDAKGRATTITTATITPAESSVTFTDITTNNANTSNHGYLKKLSNTSTDYMAGDGNWTTLPVTASNTATLTNKRWTARVTSQTTVSATPSINTDNQDIWKVTAQTADITSFTTNLSGTPVDGDILEIQITGTAARALTWGSSFVSTTVTLPTTTVTTATLTVILQYYTTSSYGNNKWHCVNSY